MRTIATPSDQVLNGPKVGIDAQGNALLAWTRWDGNDFRVQARTLSAAGQLGLIADALDRGPGRVRLLSSP